MASCPDRVLSGCWGVLLSAASARAQQEPPYFVTYSSVMEEPGNLEIENQNIAASPKNANAFFAPTVEFEYGVTAWWTAEAYLQGQVTANDSAVFTGFRFESRFRPLPRDRGATSAGSHRNTTTRLRISHR